MKEIPSCIKRHLWEYDTSDLDLNSVVVIQRVLEYGSPSEYRYIKKNVGVDRIKKVFIQKIDVLSPKTVKFYKIVLWLKDLNHKSQSMYDKLHKPVFARNIGQS